MLHLYDKNHNKVKGLKKYKDYNIESVLSTADKTLSFSYPSNLGKDIVEECYLRNKKDEFIVKAVESSGEWFNITATVNVEDLEGKAWKSFETIESTIGDSLNLAFAGTGWIVKSSSISKKRTIRMTNTNAWLILQQAIKTYRCEIQLDSINKTVEIKEKIGEDKGVYFIDSLNLISLNTQSDSYDFYTRLIAIGKTTTTGEGDEAVETTLEVTVENFQYSNKIKTLIWKDERYTDEASLREDATYKLEEISKPYRSYSVEIKDLANMNEKYKNILAYNLGDTATIISDNFKDKQRIVKLVEYPDEPERNSCELGNIKLTFEEVQKEQEEVSNTVSNITSDDGTIAESAIKDVVKKLVAGTINVDELNALKINVGKLEATVAEINKAYIDKAYIDKLIANYATIANLEAALAKIGTLETDYATIRELLAGNITSGNIQTGGITGDNLNMDTIFVKDGNILDLSAGKITSGLLDTSKVTIQSKNGNITIADGTQQFKDNNGVVRLQLGQDAKGNFTFSLFDETGTGVLIDSTGIHEGAIADGTIKEDMIGDGEIGGGKINWSSFVQEFNKDTNTNTILASKILIDGTAQNALLHFNSIENKVDENIETTGTHTTQINTQQGKINTLIQDTSIVKDGVTTKLKDEYNKTVDTVSTHTKTLASQETVINDLDGTIGEVSTKVNSVEKTLDSTVSTLSETNTKVTDMEKTVSTQGSSISQLQTDITFKVTQQDVNTSLKPLSEELTKFKTDTNASISSVNKSVTTLRDDVNGSIKDGIINEAEAITIKNSIDNLNKEKVDIVARYTTTYANANLTGTPKTTLNAKYTAFTTAHTNLISAINSMIADNVATEAEKVIYNAKLNEYSTALSLLSQAFDSAIYNISLNEAIAKDTALQKALQSNIDDVSKVATDVKNAIGDYTADGILDEAEKESVRTYLKTLASERADVDKEYTTLYGTTDLTGTAKTNLKTAYDNFVLKYNDLITKINTILNAAAITEVMRTNVAAAFASHDTYLATYSQRVNEGITAISEKKKQDSITTSNNYYDAQIKLDKQALTTVFTEMHNEGYEQGITTINKDGIGVTHSGAGTSTKMSAQGFSIIDNATGDVLAWLSSKTQWTELNVNKVFANNIENVYEGSDYLYVNHSYVGDSDGSLEKPFSSFADLQSYLEKTPLINLDLYITVMDPGYIIHEQLYLHHLSGTGILKVILNGTLVIMSDGNGVPAVRFAQISKFVWFISGRQDGSNNTGAVIQDNPNIGGGGHGIMATDILHLEVDAMTIACKNWGIVTERTDLYTWHVDFGKCYTAVELRYMSMYYSSDDVGSGTNFCIIKSGSKAFWGYNGGTPRRPIGNCVASNGIFYSFANCVETPSPRYPTSNPAPPTGTQTYAQSFGWTAHKTYQYQWSNWDDSDCKQGSWGYGLRGGHMFFDIASIRSFLGGTVLDGNTITLTRASSGGLSGGANVYINGSTCGGASGTPGYSNQTLLGTLAWGESKTFTLPKAIVQSLKSGACSSLAVYVNSTAQSNYLNIVNCSITLKVSK